MRTEFSKKTKRQAWERSGGFCEAQVFENCYDPYGLLIRFEFPAYHCGASLRKGKEFDHLNADCNDGDNSLENCLCVCLDCHAYKTAKIDIPRAAKTVRMRDKHTGIKGPKKKIPSRGFKQFKSNTKYVNEGY